MRKRSAIAFGIAAIVVVDLATKLMAAKFAAPDQNGVIVPVRNTAFSLGVARAPFNVMIVVAAIGTAFAARWTYQRRMHAWVTITLVGGALANLIDRSISGYVHDFIATPWVVFNLADIAVIVGLLGGARELSRSRRTRDDHVVGLF